MLAASPVIKAITEEMEILDHAHVEKKDVMGRTIEDIRLQHMEHNLQMLAKHYIEHQEEQQEKDDGLSDRTKRGLLKRVIQVLIALASSLLIGRMSDDWSWLEWIL